MASVTQSNCYIPLTIVIIAFYYWVFVALPSLLSCVTHTHKKKRAFSAYCSFNLTFPFYLFIWRSVKGTASSVRYLGLPSVHCFLFYFILCTLAVLLSLMALHSCFCFLWLAESERSEAIFALVYCYHFFFSLFFFFLSQTRRANCTALHMSANTETDE